MSDPSTLSAAVQGSHTVFLVTTPAWGAGAPDAELTDGKNVADACKAAGVQHLVFSSLLHVTKETGGRLKHVPRFDHKADVEAYIRASGVPATFGEDGVFTLAYPVGADARFPLIEIGEDMGKYVVASIKQRTKVLGAQVLAAADYYTPTRILKEFEEVTGQKTRFVQVDPQAYKAALPMPDAIAQELLENHLFIGEPGYFAGKDLKSSLDLLAEVGLKPTSFKEYLEKNKSAFA
ncbi:putative family transcriptional regulator [Diplodia seriata]|uniref:Putative family transcriptional regulator n=1 Tax=Diplodia seriata TaxID=420778 RepID=A0A0G2EE11_9PEZI|nr:putative family transcriptional regulator [Diplodia seriata]